LFFLKKLYNLYTQLANKPYAASQECIP